MLYRYPIVRKAVHYLTIIATISGLLLGIAQPQYSVHAASSLTVTPITWDVVGLDSNNPSVGPNNFPVGVRACNPASSTTSVNAVQADFTWTSSNSAIVLRSGSLDPIIPNPAINLAPGQCTDFYFEVSIDRLAAPYDQFRRYRIDVSGTDSGSGLAVTASSPTPRQIYVEHLVSQSRNSVSDVRLDGISIPAGGAMNLLVGNTYSIELVGFTATNGYEQIESYINFPNTIFQVLNVATTYTAKPLPATDPLWASKMYADGCGWVNNPNLPTYKSCTSTGKYGGNITVTYQVRVISGGGTSQTLNALIYDFSGSSFHYNADYSVGSRIANIIDPTNVSISKSFSPNPTNVTGISALTITLTNPNPGELSGFNFIDTLPTNLVITTPPNATTTSCGTPTLTANAGSSTITFQNGTLSANSNCTIKVNVTPSTTGSFTNTTNHLYINTLDTGKFATAILNVNDAPPPPPVPTNCSNPEILASWTMPTAGQGSGGPPPPYTTRAADVTSAVASYTTLYGAQSISTIGYAPSGPNSWGGSAPTAASGGGGWNETASSMRNYFQFILDTSKYGGVYASFDINPYAAGDWANPNSNVFINTSADGGAFTAYTPVPTAGKNSWTSITTNAFPTGTSTTTFRLGVDGAGTNKPNATLLLDNIIFRGCPILNPPTITKVFSPDPIAINGVSTLTFTLTNPNASNALNGVTFTDTLPTGLQVAATPNASTTCGGTPTWAPIAGSTTLTFGSPTGATIPLSSSCIVRVNVTGIAAGAYQNVSGFISSTNGGTNTSPSGSAQASLTVIRPPEISKLFSPNPILAGGTSTLTFTLENPNQNNDLLGVAFSDSYPAGISNVSPIVTTNTCGGTLTTSTTPPQIALSGGTIPAGGSCAVSINVTAAAEGSYLNSSSTVTSTNGGTGNTAADTLVISPAHPAISVLKQISTGASGPWSSFLPVSVGSDIYYRFIVSNDGDVPLTGVNVTDPLVSTAGCAWHNGDGTLLTAPFNLPVASAANDQYYAVCVLGPIITTAGTHPNTATATGTYNAVSYTDTSSATYATTGVTLDKTVVETSYAADGDLLHYNYLVTNNGAARLLGPVMVTDDRVAVSCPALDTVGNLDVFLDPGESVTCTATYTITAADITARSVTNTASATIYGVTSNTDSTTVNMPFPDLTTTKTNDVLDTIPEFGTFNWTIVVSNSGASAAVFSSPQTILSDVLPGVAGYYPQGALVVTNGAMPPTGTINCSIAGTSLTCNAADAVTLPVGSSFSVTFPVTPTAVGSLANTAVVDPDTHVDESNEANNSSLNTVTVTDVLPDISATKTAVPISIPETGGNVDFTYTVTNNSSEPAEITVLSDNRFGILAGDVDCQVGTILAPLASCSFDATFAVPAGEALATHVNTFTATVTDGDGNTDTATADATVTYTDVLPTVTLDKSAAPASLAEPGGAFTYTLTITNTSLESVTITALIDDNPLSPECLALIGTSLAAGANTSCSYSVTHTEAGTYPNNASVTVQDNDWSSASDTDSETVTVTDVLPTVTLDKSAAPLTLAEPGGAFTFTLTITNTSVESVTITTLTDDNPLSADCTNLIGDVLAAGANTSCTYSVTHTEPGTYPNDASVTVSDNEGNTASDTDSETVTVTDILPAVALDKSVVPASIAEPGGLFTYTLSITNNSVEPVTITALSDDNPLSAECTALIGTSLASGTSTSCTYTATHTNAGTYPNDASVTVQDNEGNSASDTDSESVSVTDVLPTVDLVKTAVPVTLAEPGGAFTFTLTITNTSVEPVTITALTDDNPLSAECNALVGTSLAAGGSASCTYTVTHTEARSYPNTAQVTVQDNEGNSASDTDSASVSVTDVLPTVDLVKSAVPATLPEPGGAFTYTLTITNTSIELMTITGLTDDNGLSAECLALIGTSIPAGGTASCTYTVAHAEAGTYPNNASVTVQDNETNSASDTDSETVTVTDVLPTVTLDKSVLPATLAEPGGVFTYMLTITNTSPESVTITALTDDNPLSPACTALIGSTLAAGANTSCTYTVSHTDAGTYPNTAQVTVQDNETNSVSASDSASVTVTDVAPTVTLNKSALPLTLPEPGGVFTYTLTITNTSTEAVTISALTDDNALSAECLALVGKGLSAGASTSCTYTVNHAEAGTYPNTAVVTVQDNEGTTGTGTDNETVTVTNTPPTVTLDKSVAPATMVEPGGDFTYTLTITNTSPEAVTITALTDDNPLSTDCTNLIGDVLGSGASASCTYIVTRNLVGVYPNTANVTVTDNEGSTASANDSASVSVTTVPPAVDLDKSVIPASLAEPGGDFTFTLTITNTGIKPFTITTLTDDNPLSASCLALIGTSLGVGGSTSCNYTVNHAEAGIYPNTANITVTDTDGNTATDSDAESVTVTDVLPAVTLDKSGVPLTLPEPGGVFTFTLTITNNSVEAVTITGLTDDNGLSAACLALIGTSIPAGGSVSCANTASHTEPGTYTNNASVTVQDNEGNTASDSDSESVAVTDVLPTVTLDKSVLPATLAEPGGVFTYTLQITNTSPETVTITTLTDDNPLSAACTALIGTTLASGAGTSCTYTVSHTEAGTYNNTANITVSDNEGNLGSASDSESATVIDVLPTVTLDKSVAPASLPEPGGIFTYTLTITNTSPESVTITALTDDNPMSPACTALIGSTLAAGANTSCSYTVTHTEAGTYPNTAQVTVRDNEDNTASDSDGETVTVTDVLPVVTLDKSVAPASLPEPSGDFTYTLTITNTSVETVTITALTDDNALSVDCTNLVGDTLAAGASTSCTYTASHTDPGTYPNTAVVTVQDNEGNTASDTDSESVSVTDVLPTVTLSKTVLPAALPEPGGVFNYTLTITNTSVEPVTITDLTDDNALSAECLALVGTSLAAGASTNCTYTVTHTEAGSYPNDASVTVEDNEANPVTDTSSASVTVTDVLPTVTLDKSVVPGTLAEPGGVFTYTLTITNTSPESVSIIALTDDNPLSPACLALIGTSIATGGSSTCSYTVSHTETGVYPNTANVTVVDNEGNTANAADNASVTVTDVLPTATIDKTAIPASLPEPGGIFTYTLTINNTSVEAVTITALTDDNSLSAACLALVGTSLAAGDSTSCTYTTTRNAVGVYPNTATVTVEDNEGNPTSDSDSESVSVTDVLPTVDLVKSAAPATLAEPGGAFTFTLTITNTSVETVTITALTDDNPLSPACTALIGTSLAAGAGTSCTYDVTHTEAGVYPNNASVTVTDNEGNTASDGASASVTVTDELPAVDLDKSVIPASLAEPGGVFTYTLTITNASVEDVTITALIDDNPLSAACLSLIGTSLPAGGGTSCTYTATRTEAGTYPNSANVTVSDNEGNTASDTDNESVAVTDMLPTVTLDKSVAPANLPEPGGVFTYTLVITNTSVESVTISALTDSNPLSAACTALIGTSLASGASTSCTYPVTQTDPGTYPNTANVTIADNEGNTATGTDSDSVTVTDALPAVILSKTVVPASLPEPGGVFTYTLSITNTSTEAVTITALADDNPLSAACTALVGTSLGASATTSCTYTVSQTEAGTYPNDASVTVEDNDGNTAGDTASESVSVTDVLPAVVLDKSVVPAILPLPGGIFTYTLDITNNGVEDVTITALTDTNPLSPGCLALVGTTLGVGASTSCTYDVTQTAIGVYPNTAEVTIQDNEGNSAQDDDTATAEVTDVIADLAIVKTASADPVDVNAAFSYTLAVTNNGPDDAANLSVIDDLPADAVYVSTAAPGWTCSYDIPTDAVSCTLPALAVGSTSAITISMTAPAFETTLSNQAAVTGSVSDPDPSNNADTLDILVVQSDPDALSKSLTATSEAFTADPNVAIGEVLTYEVIITVPPGTFATSQLVDTLGQGLAYVDCTSIVPENANLTTSIAGGFAGICTSNTPTEYPAGNTDDINQGRLITYDFGTLTNTDTGPLQLTVTYRAVVLDAVENQDGDLLTNSAVYSWAGGSVGPATGGAVRVREPELSIDKDASAGFVRVGDTVTFTITIAHIAASNTNAYDVLITDVVPAELQVIPASLDCTLGAQDADTCAYDAGTSTITAGWLNFTLGGGNGAVRFQATVLSIPAAGGITNTAAVEWTSIPLDPGQISRYNTLSTERYYDPADPANNYGTDASVTLNALGGAALLPSTGFAPGVRTDLSGLKVTQYSQNADLSLEIPSLKLNLPIVGVPLQNGDWDLNWLWNQAGWLQGTAYPTLEGNSVLTAHVYLPNGLPGPFIDLGKLYWGQEIVVHSNGERYIYQVREVKKIKPDDLSVFKHEDRSWLTLLTCKEYDEKTGSYRSRLVVRAVLIRIESDTN